MLKKQNIRTLSQDELKEVMVSWGEKGFRAKQVHEWLWKKGISAFSEMRNVNSELIQKLSDRFDIYKLNVEDVQLSGDGTIKSAFRLHDGNVVEGVLIPSTKRMTACISSQVGCSLSCAFCATGKLGRIRNLTADEIYDQVVAVSEQCENIRKKHLTNIVYMGMGEPLLNYKETLRSIKMITSDEGLGMSPRRITVSTAGIAKMIRKLGDDKVKFNLALSLHAANDEKRSKIMEINKDNSLSELSDALKYFYDMTGSRITFEYILFKNFNDGLEDAKELAEFSKVVPVKINLIEYNSVDGVNYEKADDEKIDAFSRFLQDRNMIVNIRRSRGKDIDAACGQLANKNAAYTKGL